MNTGKNSRDPGGRNGAGRAGTQHTERSAMVRYIYLTVGLINVGIGIVGAFLPVLPTTGFMIIALWCFARSSRRFHDWLYNHPVFGPPLQNWVEHGSIPRRAKIAAISAMAVSLGIVVYFSEDIVISVLVAMLMAVGAGYILSRPSLPPPPPPRH